MIDDCYRWLAAAELPQQEWPAFERALSHHAPQAIRLYPRWRAHSLVKTLESLPWHADGFWWPDSTRPGGTLAYAAGAYYIQDAASLLPLTLLAAQPGEVICDLCAAPGGKATGILADLSTGSQAQGWLLANETIRSRIAPLALNLARVGSPNYMISQRDPSQLADLRGPAFDAVLVDAPCSGQSLWSKTSPAREAGAFAPERVAHCAARQARVLAAAKRLVRPGGRLVYSTCTFSRSENEEVLQPLLAEGWQMEPMSSLRSWESPHLPGSYRLWPHRDRCAGGFAARLRKPGDLDPDSVHRSHSLPSLGKRSRAAPASGQLPELSDCGRLQAAVWQVEQANAYAWPSPPPEGWISGLAGGPEVAYRVQSTWFAAHALALRQSPEWTPHCRLELSDEQAVDYMAGESLELDERGWLVATWHDQPLGWLKGDGRRARNRLPKSARMRMP